MGTKAKVLIEHMVLILIFLILIPIYISAVTTAAATSGVSAFAGFSDILNLIPLLILVGGLGLVSYDAYKDFKK